MQMLTTFTVQVKSICRSHTRTVVRECFKGDEASQWGRPKFDPSPVANSLQPTPLNAYLRKIFQINDVVPGKEVPLGGLDDYIFI